MKALVQTTLWISILGSVVYLNVAQADSSARDLIVRYRAPVNELSDVRGFAGTELLNSEQGVVKLHLADQRALEKARAELLNSGDVVSVSTNHLYKTALHIGFKTADAASETMLSTAFTAPFMSLSGGIPDVMLPKPQTSGADPLVGQDWAMDKIGMSRIPSFVGFQNGLVAAVIDTGVDYNHEDLIASMWRSPSNPREVGYDFAHGNAKPYDVVNFDIQSCLKDPDCAAGKNQQKYLSNPGHGTHCAGHIAATANNSRGIMGVGGPAKVKVMGLKFFYDAGEDNAGQGDDAAAIKSIDYAIKNGAKVISASWGGRGKREDAESSELKQALIRAQQAGVLVVIAAGNDGVDQDSVEDPSYPAAFDLDNLIVVAATDQNDALADFSSYGQRSVHIGAPGVKIFSTTVGSKYSDVIAKFQAASGKEISIDWDGTSMATPIVAGAVSLVWSRYPNEDYHQIRDRILRSARKVSGLDGKVATGGVLDVRAALGM